jgi:hypothetical protein
MTVKDLIIALKKYPEDMKIYKMGKRELELYSAFYVYEVDTKGYSGYNLPKNVLVIE